MRKSEDEFLQIGEDFTRPGAVVVDLAAHRKETLAPGHAPGTEQVDGTA